MDQTDLSELCWACMEYGFVGALGPCIIKLCLFCGNIGLHIHHVQLQTKSKQDDNIYEFVSV